MTRGQLLAVALVEVGAAGVAGAAVACGVAIAASPLMPIGPARLAEPDPGPNVNVPVLAAGFAATVILLVAWVAWPAWRLASARHSAERDAAGEPGRRSRAAEWLGRSGAPVTAVSGVRLALDPGQGRTAVPVRSALLGLALSAAAVAAAVTFGANLLHLVHTPHLYGQDWDAAVDLRVLDHHATAIRQHHSARAPASPAGRTAFTAQCRSAWPAGTRRSRDRAGRRPGTVDIPDLAGWPPATISERDRLGDLGSPPARTADRAVGARHGRRSPAAIRSHRRPGRLPLLRRGQLHAHRPRSGCDSHCGDTRAAGGSGWQWERIQLRPRPVRLPGRAARRTSPASTAPWVLSAPE